MKKEKIKSIAFWITMILGPVSFVVGGFLYITQDEQVMATIGRLGYPPYFAIILGVGKLLAAIAIAIPGFPRLKEWAYAGFFFDLTAARRHHTLSQAMARLLSPSHSSSLH